MSSEQRAYGQESETIRELYEIFGGLHEVLIDGEAVFIKPLTLGNLPAFLAAYSRSDIPDNAEEADVVPGASIRAIEILTGRDSEWLQSLSEQSMERVMRTVVDANPTLFGAEEPGRLMHIPRGRIEENSRALQLSIAQLVEAGHSLSCIQGYTLKQVDVLCRAHARLAAERQINAMVAARAGQAVDRDFKEVVGSLKAHIDKL